MDKSDIKVGNIVTLEDGRKVVISKVHPDSSFEWDLAPEKKEDPVKEEKVEEKESIKKQTTKKTPEKAKTKRTVKK